MREQQSRRRKDNELDKGKESMGRKESPGKGSRKYKGIPGRNERIGGGDTMSRKNLSSKPLMTPEDQIKAIHEEIAQLKAGPWSAEVGSKIADLYNKIYLLNPSDRETIERTKGRKHILEMAEKLGVTIPTFIVNEKCLDCGKMRLGQEGIKHPRCDKCFTAWASAEKKNRDAQKKADKLALFSKDCEHCDNGHNMDRMGPMTCKYCGRTGGSL